MAGFFRCLCGSVCDCIVVFADVYLALSVCLCVNFVYTSGLAGFFGSVCVNLSLGLYLSLKVKEAVCSSMSVCLFVCFVYVSGWFLSFCRFESVSVYIFFPLFFACVCVGSWSLREAVPDLLEYMPS